jgi:type IV pilus assembly protein PilO
MKMTPREQVLLVGLLLVALLAGSYYFLITPQLNALSKLKEDQTAVKVQYDSVKADLAQADAIKANFEKLAGETDQATARYFPSIIQERIVLIFDDLFTKSGVPAASISYTFNDATTAPPTQSGQSPTTTATLAELAASYAKLNGGTAPTPTPSQPAMTEEELAAYQASLGSLTSLNVSIQFTAPYTSLRQFVSLMEGMKKTVFISSLNITQLDDTSVTGNMELVLYAIPKLTRQDTAYEAWSSDVAFGKENPFQPLPQPTPVA